MSKLVSILVPAYNAEKWITQTIDSALSQSWAPKEIIVVDDGSTDRTLEIARTFEPRGVRIATQNNRGAAAARNRALSLAGGEFIQWLDADDLLAPDKIALQMKAAEGDRTDLTLYTSPHGVFYYRFKKATFIPNSLWQDLSPVDWLVTSLSEMLWMNPAAWLVSRAITDRAGPWDERLSLNDDGEYFGRVVAACRIVRFIPEAKCYYRQSSFGQLSRSRSEKAADSLLLSTVLRVRALLKLEMSTRTKQAALALIRTWMPVFYPDKAEAVEQLRALVKELGGELEPPRFGWRSRALQRLFGPEKGKRLRTWLRSLRMAAAVKWDEWMWRWGI